MEYSLHNLNKQTQLNKITSESIINKLNLIGFEVDDIIIQPLIYNSLINDIRLILKIPANREDLLNEILLLNEFSTIFSLKKYKTWKNLKKNYLFLLKQKYTQKYNYQSSLIFSDLSNIAIYNLKIENFESFMIPLWIKEKLKNFGFQTTNSLNDILNLVCLEWGQKIDFYFNQNITNLNENFYCNRLLKEEIFVDFNNNQYILPIGTIVLKNSESKILNVLGILTPLIESNKKLKKTIFFEAIFYDIHSNSLNLTTINTNLSFRYLRKSFLDHLRFSFQRLLTLFEILSPSLNLKIEKYSTYSKVLNLKVTSILKLKKNSLLKFLNIKDFDINVFKKAGLIIVGNTKKEIYFKISNSRKDLSREIDLIEEYCRFIGYDNFKEILPKKSMNCFLKSENKYKFIKEFFLNFGFNETINSSIQEETMKKNQSILINNPLNNDFFLLRTELVSKIIENFENNLRLGFSNNNFFEIGRSFKKIKNQIIEEDKISGIFQSFSKKNVAQSSIDWFINKSFFENFFKLFGYKDIIIEPIISTFDLFHPKRSILFKTKNKILGVFGEVHPRFNFKIPTYVFELNLNDFKDWRKNSSISNYQEYSKYPSITKDISFLINKNTNFNNLKNEIQNICNNLKNIYFFDIYFNPSNINQISIGIRLEFQSFWITLTNEEIEKEITKIKNILNSKFEVHLKS